VDEIITPREGGRHGDATLLWAERSKGLWHQSQGLDRAIHPLLYVISLSRCGGG
jgi:hypothetical protein